jgi:L-aminopeptidase/D-esterase-like protein
MRYCSAVKRSIFPVAGVAVLAMSSAGLEAQAPARVKTGLTTVDGLKVGHHTLTERPAGCTAILVDSDAVGGVSQRGGAPGTRETDLLTQATGVAGIPAARDPKR